jgi:hypothetical protein
MRDLLDIYSPLLELALDENIHLALIAKSERSNLGPDC